MRSACVVAQNGKSARRAATAAVAVAYRDGRVPHALRNAERICRGAEWEERPPRRRRRRRYCLFVLFLFVVCCFVMYFVVLFWFVCLVLWFVALLFILLFCFGLFV
jgi:Flp pilus assembly protein TadB